MLGTKTRGVAIGCEACRHYEKRQSVIEVETFANEDRTLCQICCAVKFFPVSGVPPITYVETLDDVSQRGDATWKISLTTIRKN